MNNKKKKVHKYKRANLLEEGGQLIDQIQSLIPGTSNLTTNISNNLSVPNTQSPAIQAGTKEDLFNAWGNYNPVKLGRSNNVGSSVSSGLSGASAGLTFGPVGAAVGGGVGLIGGLVSSIFGNKKRERRERQLNYENQRNFGAMADTLNAQDIDMQASNYFKKGGGIHIKKKNRGKFTEYCGGKVTSECIQRGLHSSNPTTRKRANFARNARKWQHTNGGYLLSNGGQITNGVTVFENGGTHEQNPNMGILQGYDQNGVPNLVEEGEVKYNDYIYSNRLKPSKNLLIQANLDSKKYEGQTYAQIAKDINKESKERPNDPISKRGLSTNMSRLQAIQEVQRAQTEQDDMQQANIGQDGMYLNIRPGIPSSEEMEQDYIDLGGTQPIIDNFNPLYDLSLNAMSAPQPVDQATAEKIQSNNFDANQPQNPRLNTAQQYSSYLRYVPALGTAVGVATDALGATNKPNYNSAERMEKLRVTPTSIGNYLTYRPFDRNYYINQLNSNAGATRRALQNASAGNRATYAAGLLSADYNQGMQLGQLARQAEEYNLAQRQAVEQFNRGTNMANAEMDMRAQQINNDYIQRAAALRDNARIASSQARSVNLSNLFNSLGDIGREQATRNMILTNPASPYYMTADGRIVYKGTK